MITLPPSWQGRAACIGTDAELFTGPLREQRREREARVAEARAVCAACPVREPCAEWFLPRPLAAVAGGLTEDERAGLAAERGIRRLCQAWRHVLPLGVTECRRCRTESQLASQYRLAAARKEVAA